MPPTNMQSYFEVILLRRDEALPESFGAYTRRELAQEVLDTVYNNWSDSDEFKPLKEDFEIMEFRPLDRLPEFHYWVSYVDIQAGQEDCHVRMQRPTVAPLEPDFERLDDPVQFTGNPLKQVYGSGVTRESALAAALAHRETAVSRGALEMLAVAERIQLQAHQEALRQEEASGKNVYGAPIVKAWQIEGDLIEQLARSHYQIFEAPHVGWFDKFLSGEITDVDSVDDAVEEWHAANNCKKTLQEYLGMPLEVYQQWVVNPDVLKQLKK